MLVMAYRHARLALRRAAMAAALGLVLVGLAGPELLVPALALVALVYWMHPLVAALAGDEGVPNPNLAFVIVVNAAVVLIVQALLFASELDAF